MIVFFLGWGGGLKLQVWVSSIGLRVNFHSLENKKQILKPKLMCPFLRLSSQKTLSVFFCSGRPILATRVHCYDNTIVDFTLDVQSVDRPYFRRCKLPLFVRSNSIFLLYCVLLVKADLVLISELCK